MGMNGFDEIDELIDDVDWVAPLNQESFPCSGEQQQKLLYIFFLNLNKRTLLVYYLMREEQTDTSRMCVSSWLPCQIASG